MTQGRYILCINVLKKLTANPVVRIVSRAKGSGVTTAMLPSPEVNVVCDHWIPQYPASLRTQLVYLVADKTEVG